MSWNIYYYLKSDDQIDQQIFTIDRLGINDNQLNSFVEFMIKQELSFIKAYNNKIVTFDHKKKIVKLGDQ